MSRFALLLFFLFPVILFSQDTAIIVKKKAKFPISNSCSDSLTWEEIAMNNKAVESKINSAIYKEVISRKVPITGYENYCKGIEKYHRINSISFTHPKVVSARFQFQIYNEFDYVQNPEKTTLINFNTTTGDAIKFSQLFDPLKLKKLDSFVYGRFTDEIAGDYVPSLIRNNYPDLNFQYAFFDTQIDVYLHGISSGGNEAIVSFSYDELAPYAAADGILKYFIKPGQK